MKNHLVGLASNLWANSLFFTSNMLQLILLHEAIIKHTYDLFINFSDIFDICKTYSDFQILPKLVNVDRCRCTFGTSP